jgi:hypothetical protein
MTTIAAFPAADAGRNPDARVANGHDARRRCHVGAEPVICSNSEAALRFSCEM